METEKEIIETIKDIVDIQEQQINPNRKNIEEILKKAKRDFFVESAIFEICGADNRGLLPIENIDSNVLYNKLPYYKSLYLEKLKDKLDDEIKYNEIMKKYNINENLTTLWPPPGGDGAEVIYALRNSSTLSKKILDAIEDEGQNVRKYYQLRLPSNPSKDYYFMHRDTPNNETVIVEYGFIDSPEDDVEQIKKYYKDYAEAVVKSVLDYKGIKYTPPLGSDYYVVKKGDTLFMGNNE